MKNIEKEPYLPGLEPEDQNNSVVPPLEAPVDTETQKEPEKNDEPGKPQPQIINKFDTDDPRDRCADCDLYTGGCPIHRPRK